jgi:capsular polysaccharide biosynthesis protein
MANKLNRRFAYRIAIAAFLAVWIVTFFHYSYDVFFPGTSYVGTAIIELNGMALNSDSMKRQIQVIRSPVILGPVIEKLGAVHFWRKLLSVPPNIGLEESDLTNFLASELLVNMVPDSTKIKIQCCTPRSSESALMANCMADTYLDYMAKSQNQIQVQIVDRAQPSLQLWKVPDAGFIVAVSMVLGTFYGAIASGLAILSMIFLRKAMPVPTAIPVPSNFTCAPIKPKY